MKYLTKDEVDKHPDKENPAKRHLIAGYDYTPSFANDIFNKCPWCQLIILPTGDGYSRSQ